MAMACSEGKGGRRSCRLDRSAAISALTRSERVASTWPSLINVGPMFWRAAARRTPRRCSVFCRRDRVLSSQTGSTPSKTNSASCRASVCPMPHRRQMLRSPRITPAPHCESQQYRRTDCCSRDGRTRRRASVRPAGFGPGTGGCFRQDTDRTRHPRSQGHQCAGWR